MDIGEVESDGGKDEALEIQGGDIPSEGWNKFGANTHSITHPDLFFFVGRDPESNSTYRSCLGVQYGFRFENLDKSAHHKSNT